MPAIARRGPVAIAVLTSAVLVTTAGRYGYHRDELYFRAAGLHPAFGYVDQPPLTPLLARAGIELFGDSLTGLRVLAALAIGLVVLLAGLIARELGGGPGVQALASAATAVSGFPLAVGHMLSTDTLGLLTWTALGWLLIRALRDGGARWLPVGLVAGIGLQNKALMAALLAAIVVGLVISCPRTVLRDRWLWLGVLLAVAVWAPNLVWQALHGWPQLRMVDVISGGGTGFSTPRWSFLPYQLVLYGLLLTPIWLAGWWRLARDQELVRYRCLAVAFVVLFVALIAANGKAYYATGIYPLLLGAGAEPVVRWFSSARSRRTAIGAALTLTAAVNVYLFLPLVPADRLAGSPVPTVNPTAAETVGWPEFAATLSAAYRSLPPDQRAHTVVLGNNYGEAGAVDRFRGEFELPAAFSGQNSYHDWGPPPESATGVLAVRVPEPTLRRWFVSVTPVAHIDNRVGLDNDEQGQVVWLCQGRNAPWTTIWPELRRVG